MGSFSAGKAGAVHAWRRGGFMAGELRGKMAGGRERAGHTGAKKKRAGMNGVTGG
ncbi:MAG: hypothetical protein WCT04_09675 [Planctomycetota bacterium]